MHCKKQDISEAVFLFVWAMGLLGVATCLADKITDEFESHTVHHVTVVQLVERCVVAAEVGESCSLRHPT